MLRKDKAGIRKDDIVIIYRGKQITNASVLRNEVAIGPIGQEAKVTVLRKGKKQELTVKIGNLEDAAKLLSASVKERLGVELRPVTPDEVNKYGLDPQQGVAITWLDSKGPLGQLGFEVGDIILEINGQSVESVEDISALMSTVKPGQRIAVFALDHKSGNAGYVEVVVR